MAKTTPSFLLRRCEVFVVLVPALQHQDTGLGSVWCVGNKVGEGRGLKAKENRASMIQETS